MSNVIVLADYRASRAPKRDCMAEALEVQAAFIAALGLRTETALEHLSTLDRWQEAERSAQIPSDSE